MSNRSRGGGPPSRTAVKTAARQLGARGCSWLAGHNLASDDGQAWLTDIAAYIQSSDPIEIGAAALLEATGYERSQQTLF